MSGVGVGEQRHVGGDGLLRKVERKMDRLSLEARRGREWCRRRGC